MVRKFPRKIRRVVVKVGSSLIANYMIKPRGAHLRWLIHQIVGAQKQDHIDFVLVSSGAIALGMGELNTSNRPKDVATLQALAAIGQTALMRTYANLFEAEYEKLFKTACARCAQVLLTWDDFDERVRYNNARRTIEAIIDQGVIPIINENDTISIDEIKFGDNDKLSALVASLIHADLLVILSDVEGLYDIKNGSKKVFKEIKEITREIEGMAKGTTNHNMSKGGMSAKLEAIKIATHARIPCVIANGETNNVLTRIIAGERIGTLFVEKEEKLLARKHWISFGAKPKGIITIDDGARDALLKGGKSLLLPGVVKAEGHFKVGDVVKICDCQRQEIARGISNYSTGDLHLVLHKEEERRGKKEVIHVDDLVLSRR